MVGKMEINSFFIDNPNCGMCFKPLELKILINWDLMKKVSCWKRQVIALYFHELTHLFQWLFICRCDPDKYINYKNVEKIPDKIQDFILKMLFVQVIK